MFCNRRRRDAAVAKACSYAMHLQHFGKTLFGKAVIVSPWFMGVRKLKKVPHSMLRNP